MGKLNEASVEVQVDTTQLDYFLAEEEAEKYRDYIFGFDESNQKIDKKYLSPPP